IVARHFFVSVRSAVLLIRSAKIPREQFDYECERKARIASASGSKRRRKDQILGWYMIGQPDAVGGEEELPARLTHLAGEHLQDDRFAVPLAHFRRRCFIWREMDVLPLA